MSTTRPMFEDAEDLHHRKHSHEQQESGIFVVLELVVDPHDEGTHDQDSRQHRHQSHGGLHQFHTAIPPSINLLG